MFQVPEDWSPAKKSRLFWIVYYPQEHKHYRELCEILSRMHSKIAMSPLHTEDAEEGEPLKPHYHIIFYYSGPKTVSQFYTTLLSYDLLSGCAGYKDGNTEHNMKYCFRIPDDKEGATRYLIHLNNPERQQFPEGFKAIKIFGGFDMTKAMACNYSERFNIFCEIIHFCKAEHCYFYHDLIDYCYENEKFTWLNYILATSMPIQLYLNSYIKKTEYIKNNQIKDYQIEAHRRELAAGSSNPLED